MTETLEHTEIGTTNDALPCVRVMLGLLNLDRGYQREIRPHKIKHLKENWNWVKFYPLRVSRRVGGSRAGELFIWDGQHRYLAASELFGEYQEIPCYISDMTYQQEAEHFARQHEGETAVGGSARFNALLQSGDHDATDVIRIIKESGYQVNLKGGGGATSGNAIQAVTFMLKFYQRMGPEGLRLVLHVASHAWPIGVPERINVRALGGIAHFLFHFPEAKVDHLIERLSHPDATPKRLMQSAAIYPTGGANRGMQPHISRSIMDKYNKNLKSPNRLTWDIKPRKMSA